jgi:hypothetical protein
LGSTKRVYTWRTFAASAESDVLAAAGVVDGVDDFFGCFDPLHDVSAATMATSAIAAIAARLRCGSSCF